MFVDRLPHGQFGPLLRGLLVSPEVDHCVFDIFRHKGHREPRDGVGSLSFGQAPSRV